MTKDKLIAMAKEVTAFHFDGTFNFDTQQLQAFANLIRKDQIELDAALCAAHATDRFSLYKGRAPYKGNEEGRADMFVQGESSGAEYCAEAIRNQEVA
jgi:hypothetical protein